MKHVVILFLTGFIHTLACAQGSLDDVLKDIEVNNPTLIAAKQYHEANAIRFKTGLTPENPRIVYNLFYDSPAFGRNEAEIQVTQSFDFPTSYVLKSRLADVRIEQVAMQLAAVRISVLWEAKRTGIILIHHLMRRDELVRRQERAGRHLSDMLKKVESGDGSLFELNKSRLQWADIHAIYKINESEIQQLVAKLTELNGNHPLQLDSLRYPEHPIVIEFSGIRQESEFSTPEILIAKLDQSAGALQVDVQRALSLPKIDIGYQRRTFSNQAFHGFQVGITIPLWEHRNQVRTQRTMSTYLDKALSDQLNRHNSALATLYAKHEVQRTLYHEYKSVYHSIQPMVVLEKALLAGQISTLEFFYEQAFYDSVVDRYLDIEMQYHLVLAELFKHRL